MLHHLHGKPPADHLATRDYLIELFAAGPHVYRFSAGRSLAYLDDILDVLSCVDTHPDEPMRQLTREIEAEKATLSSAVLILVVWNEARRRLVQSLIESGVAVKTILVASRGVTYKDLPQEVIVLSDDDVRAGRCVKL